MTIAPSIPAVDQAPDPTLRLAGIPVLELAPAWEWKGDAAGTGVFLRLPPGEAAPYREQPLGRLPGLSRFTSLHRFSPFWMRPAVGLRESEVRPDTVWLLAETASGHFILLVPLLDGASRFSLRSSAGALAVAGETGDPAVPCEGGLALFLAVGQDPYALQQLAARAISQRLDGGRLRTEKPTPDGMHLFGWCTWDAFYKNGSAGQVLAGLAGFERAGVSPRLLILDDGWQTWQRAPSGEDRLISLRPNERFGHDLAPLVQEAKSRFGIQRFFVWHALLGYWGGLDAQALPGYGVRTVARSFGPGLLEQEPRWNVLPWGAQIGVPAAERLAPFYEDLHRALAAQGVDGVKVDVQAMLEGVSAGQGGRVVMARAARRALEASVNRHFGGRLINCMSSTGECAYLSAHSSLMRTSDDFFPEQPASHGMHLFVNTMASLWFGEFMWPDWDMFQSDHQRGAFHAAARAISGGPVYVSDRVGQHDAALLHKLVLSDGSVPLADVPARPTRDTLFTDPTREAVLLKLFNRIGDGGVVGLFNVRTAGSEPTGGSVSPADVEGFDSTHWAAFAHRQDRLWSGCGPLPQPVELDEGAWELVSFAVVEQGFAVLGLADKLNSLGAVVRRSQQPGRCQIDLRDGGRLLAWAQRAPSSVECAGERLAFVHDASSGRLDVALTTRGPCQVTVRWD